MSERLKLTIKVLGILFAAGVAWGSLETRVNNNEQAFNAHLATSARMIEKNDANIDTLKARTERIEYMQMDNDRRIRRLLRHLKVNDD